jgi:UTP--glucose-1-phosphate uridylyltransferase
MVADMTESHPRITKAVIPAAGLGTRFLPATKATPKEMLPVVDKPAIQYVVEEAVSAGLDDVLMITGRNKRPLEDHFDRNYELESALQKKGDASRLAKVQESSDLATMHYVRQGDPRGLGHAVLCAAPHVGHEPFAVLLGDDLIDPRDPLLARMVEVQEQHGGSVIALMEVAPEQIHLYGCAAVETTGQDDLVKVTGLVEKPDPADAPSRYAVIGRYVLDRTSSTYCTRPSRAAAARSSSPTPSSSSPRTRRSAAPCTASSSRAAAMTPATAATTCVPLSDSHANVKTWARTSGPGSAVT